MTLLVIFFAIFLIFAAAVNCNYNSPITQTLSILNHELSNNNSLPILNITTLSTLEQEKTKGKNDQIILQLFEKVFQYETSVKLQYTEKREFRELPLLSVVKANEKGPVMVVDNPFYSQNHTLNDIRNQTVPGILSQAFVQHNFSTHGLQKLFGNLTILAQRYGEGLKQKVLLLPLVLGRHTRITPGYWTEYKLNVGIGLVAPEEDGYRALAALVLNLKSKIISGREYVAPDYYYDYDRVHS